MEEHVGVVDAVPVLGCDLGEDPPSLIDGRQEALLPHLSVCSVACGGHAGDDDTMRATLEMCARHGVRVGAHPSYPDRANFGRATLAIAPAALTASIVTQLTALQQHARAAGVVVAHAKPHGALYHDVVRDPVVAAAVADALVAAGVSVVLLPPRAALSPVWSSRGIAVRREGFVDRGYAADGGLLPRGGPGALLDVTEATAQAERLARAGAFDVLCVHSDTPDALAIARAVAATLREFNGSAQSGLRPPRELSNRRRP